jgi:hypothetical protein
MEGISMTYIGLAKLQVHEASPMKGGIEMPLRIFLRFVKPALK